MFNLEDYEDVATLNRWFIENYPMGRSNLITEMHDPDKGYIRVRAEIYRDATDFSPAVTNIAFGARDLYNRNMARYYVEDTATSALGRAIILLKGSNKTATRESMEQVSQGQAEIAKAKAKMSQTASEYVPIAKEDDPWTIREAAPASTVDEAVNLVKEIIGGQTEKDIPKCTKCDPAKEMSWKSGTGKNGKPYGKFDCWTCKEVIWYEIKADGTWGPQKAKW
jgi:hypothetical protein